MILWSITLFRFGVLERRIGIIGWFISLAHCLACCLVMFTCPLMVSASLSCCKGCGQSPWVCRCFAPTATLLSLRQTRFEGEPLPGDPPDHFPSPNNAMQPTAGHRTASLHFMKTRSLQATLALAQRRLSFFSLGRRRRVTISSSQTARPIASIHRLIRDRRRLGSRGRCG